MRIMKNISFLLFLLWSTAIMAIHCSAQNQFDLGGLAGSAFRMGFSGKGMAAANALSSTLTRECLGYYNPAIVPYQSIPTATVSVGFLPLDRHLRFASYTQSLRPSGGFSIALINAGVSSIEGRDTDGLPTQTYSTSENEFLFSFGTKLQEEFSIGVSAKILYYSLFEGVKSTTVGFDLGVLYVASPEWTIAAVVADINSKYKWDTSQLYGRDGTSTTDRFPLRRKLAATFSPSRAQDWISAEIEWIGDVLLARIGGEIRLHENFSLNGGIDQVDFNRSINPKPSIGFSVNIPTASWKPTLHYGYILEPYSSGGIHMLSLIARFE